MVNVTGIIEIFAEMCIRDSGEVLAVAADGDGALQVGAVDVHLCVPQNA